MKKVLLAYVKSTKNKHVYSDRSEWDDICYFPALYMDKSELPVNPPVLIEITMQWVSQIGVEI